MWDRQLSARRPVIQGEPSVLPAPGRLPASLVTRNPTGPALPWCILVIASLWPLQDVGRGTGGEERGEPRRWGRRGRSSFCSLSVFQSWNLGECVALEGEAASSHGRKQRWLSGKQTSCPPSSSGRRYRVVMNGFGSQSTLGFECQTFLSQSLYNLRLIKLSEPQLSPLKPGDNTTTTPSLISLFRIK